MKLILLHVNGHTAVRPGMACVPLRKSLVKSGLDLGDRGDVKLTITLGKNLRGEELE